MNIEDMRSYIRSVVEIDSSDISDETLNRFLGEGYDQVVYSEKRWPWYEAETTFTTSAGTKDYALSTIGANVQNNAVPASNVGLREIHSLRNDDHIFTLLGRDEADKVYPLDTAGNGQPYYWSFWADSARLYPTPSGTDTIYVRGYKNPTSFGVGSVDGTSPVDFPEPFHVVIATYGISRAYDQQEDPEMAVTYLNTFIRELDNLRARYLDAPAPQPLVMNSRVTSRWLSNSYLPNRLRYSWE